MYFDLALASSVLALLHVTLFFFMGYPRLALVTNVFALLALFFSSAQYISLYKMFDVMPFATFSGVMLLLAQAILLVYLVLLMKYRRPSIGLFVFPLSVLFIMAARVSAGVNVQHSEVVTSVWLYIHLPFTIIGTAFFMLSTVSGIMYFIQERQLKRKQFGIIFHRFPPLDTIDRLNNTTLYLGFYTFTIGLLAGLVWMFYSSGRINVFSPKLVFAIITWIIYSSITFYKQIKGMTPKDTALSTIVGFISVLITYIGVAFFVMG
jgi:ABC-type transport system involved in cytochrome c biogenesis permease subunit